MVDWKLALTIIVAVIGSSLILAYIEKIAQSTAVNESLNETGLSQNTFVAETAADFITRNHPNAVHVL